ncbi:MAG: single-stranded-DNA-specific exonuclease RecJ [Christensenellales bacterium]
MIRFEPRKTNSAAAVDAQAVVGLCEEQKLLPATAKLLLGRGVGDMQAFLHPDWKALHDPFLLPDMDKAVARIRLAAERGEKIGVYGDYDVDGLTSAAVLCRCLKELQADFICYIPTRQGDGYGLNEKAIRQLHTEGVTLLVTVDCGITAIAEAEIALSLGLDLIVTDHHQCGESLPNCLAVVAHTRPGATYPCPYLCGAGTAAKLVQALLGQEALLAYADLIALGTVADLVPLLCENRIFVSAGLQKISSNPNLGLKALLAASGAKMPAGSQELAYILSPRINAAGRMADPCIAFNLLMTGSEEEAARLSGELETLNALRQQQEQSMFIKAEEIIFRERLQKTMAFAVYDESFQSGIAGIVASRLAQKYARPAAVLCPEGGRVTGSLRSVEGVDIFGVLKQCAPLLERFGGHGMAGGVTLSMDNLQPFKKAFLDIVSSHPPEVFVPRFYYDGVLSPTDVTLALAADLKRLEPYGQGNPEPVFLMENVPVTGLKKVGKEGRHLQLKLGAPPETVAAVAFNKNGEGIEEGQSHHVLASFGVNEFRGAQNVQCTVSALCAALVDEQVPLQKESKFVDCFYSHFLYNEVIPESGGETALLANWAEEIANRFAASVQGTLALCYTPEGATLLLEHLKDKPNAFFRLCTGSADLTVPYNTVLLAPAAADTSCYSHVVCIDPLCAGQVPQGALTASDESMAGRSLAFLERAAMPRQALLKAYASLQRHSHQARGGMSPDDLAAAIGVSPLWLKAAAEVFGELSLVAGELPGLRFLKQEQKQDLLSSKTFARMQEAQQVYKDFYNTITAEKEVS